MTIRPRKLSNLIKYVLDLDSKATYDLQDDRLHVRFESSLAWDRAREDIGLSILDNGRIDSRDCPPGVRRYFLVWDVADLKRSPVAPAKPFSFDGRGSMTKLRREVSEQEDRVAEIIGGRRHVGSGSIEGLKSDASSEWWQAEAKQTTAKSFSLTLEALAKITAEARPHHRRPMLHIFFKKIPEGLAVDKEWVVIPANVFEVLRRTEDAFNQRDE